MIRRRQQQRNARPYPCIWLLVLLCMAFACKHATGTPGGDAPNEYQVKAAFMYNFTNYIEWPPRSAGPESNPFTIGLTEPNAFGSVLADIVTGKLVGKRPVKVASIKTTKDLAGCQMVFVDARCELLTELLETCQTKGILTVGDGLGFLDLGGMIAFLLEDKRVRFAVHLGTAKAAGLTISSHLLRLATTVRR